MERKERWVNGMDIRKEVERRAIKVIIFRTEVLQVFSSCLGNWIRHKWCTQLLTIR
jgi:hypothetical protein